jgi:acyl dehydratase
MPLNRDFIGRSRTAIDILEVTESLVREVVTQVEAADPVFSDVAAARKLGYHERMAPPSLVSRLWFSMADSWPMHEPEFGRKPGANLLLAGLRVRSYRPVLVGDRLTLTVTVKDIRETRTGRDLFALESDIATASGAPVAVTHHLMTVRHSDTYA